MGDSGVPSLPPTAGKQRKNPLSRRSSIADEPVKKKKGRSEKKLFARRGDDETLVAPRARVLAI